MIKVLSCDTCAKRKGKHCQVLTEPIGMEIECWAWSDDPAWEKKVNEATEEYRRRWLERHGGIDEAAAI